MTATRVHDFRDAARKSLSDPTLKVALDRTTGLLRTRRADAKAGYPPFEDARDLAAAIKDHTLDHLTMYLEMFEMAAQRAGAHVHWASTKAEACAIVVDICQRHEARSVTRSKSMLGEEIGLPHALADAGIERVETDLAEHIIQLAEEKPSHIVMPAMHKTHEQVGELFRKHHGSTFADNDITAMVESARKVLREPYMSADIGISGANFLLADSGGVVTVTNEGNAELTTTPPKVHIVTAGIDKAVPSWDHAVPILRLLARSATGADFTQYTTIHTGPKRPDDPDGPDEMHIVLVDNGRTAMLNSRLRPMLRCIRCAACMNHCPVYGQIGGHPYGATYPGPMGSVLTPAMEGLEQHRHLPHSCTLNGRCQEVCPVKIPLTDLIRHLREDQWRAGLIDKPVRWGLGIWGFLATRPKLYRWAVSIASPLLSWLGKRHGHVNSLALAGGWTAHRDLPVPSGGSFMSRYAERTKQSRRRDHHES